MIILLLPTVMAQDTEYISNGNVTTAVGPVFVVPESRMDELLAKAKSSDDLLALTTECVDVAVPVLAKADEALAVGTARMSKDGQLIRDLQAGEVVYEAKISKLRQQRNVAIVLTVGVLTGAGTAIALTR